MNKSFSKRVVTGVFLSLIFFSSIAASSFIRWNKSDVKPICYVKPDIGGFTPTEGSSIGNTWSKSDVLPVCLVKPDIGGFTPIKGSSIGNTWSKSEVVPMCPVKPDIGGFTPLYD